jgi:hypothetical protein
MSTWTDDGVSHGGASFGDDQVGDDWSHRYRARLADGTWVMYTYYVAVREHPEGPNGPRFFGDERFESIHCSDPDDPGSTEIFSDIVHGDGTYLTYPTQEEADKWCQRVVGMDFGAILGDPDQWLSIVRGDAKSGLTL